MASSDKEKRRRARRGMSPPPYEAGTVRGSAQHCSPSMPPLIEDEVRRGSSCWNYGEEPGAMSHTRYALRMIRKPVDNGIKECRSPAARRLQAARQS